MNVAILGASPNQDRYSNMAIHRLLEYGHQVFPINPIHKEIEGQKVYKHLVDIEEPIHTLTMYVNSFRSNDLMDDILALLPKRIIFNPGAENDVLSEKATEKGIEVLNACTLVMLSSRQF